jgi:NADPH:quinone reductase-like Zn-dependent oxidoreductase
MTQRDMNDRSTTMTDDTALWLGRGGDLRVAPAAPPVPEAHQILVRTEAVAINPVDWIVQTIGSLIYAWLSRPAVLGEDVAGEVIAVGPEVTRFRVGDRVLGLAVGTEKDRNRPEEGAFRSSTLLMEDLAAPIPDGMDAAHAVVLPLTLSTAATGLFEQGHLGLHLPSAPASATGESVVVWGAATAVGLNAVQLAVAAGYDVVATASPTHAALLLELGAREVLDRRDPAVVDRVVEALAGRRLAGVLAIGTGSTARCIEVAARVDGTKRVAAASTAVSFERIRPGRTAVPRAMPSMLRMAAVELPVRVRARRTGVRISTVWGSALRHSAVGPAIWRAFLPAALAAGRYRALPEPLVAGTGLESVPEALELQRRGVSARKVVVTL